MDGPGSHAHRCRAVGTHAQRRGCPGSTARAACASVRAAAVDRRAARSPRALPASQGRGRVGPAVAPEARSDTPYVAKLEPQAACVDDPRIHDGVHHDLGAVRKAVPHRTVEAQAQCQPPTRTGEHDRSGRAQAPRRRHDESCEDRALRATEAEHAAIDGDDSDYLGAHEERQETMQRRAPGTGSVQRIPSSDARQAPRIASLGATGANLTKGCRPALPPEAPGALSGRWDRRSRRRPCACGEHRWRGPRGSRRASRAPLRSRP